MKNLTEEEFEILLSTGQLTTQEEEPEVVHPTIEHNKILENILLQLSNSIVTQSNVQKDSLSELSNVLNQNKEVQENLRKVIDLILIQNKVLSEKKSELPKTKTIEFLVNRDDKGDMRSLTATISTSEVTV